MNGLLETVSSIAGIGSIVNALAIIAGGCIGLAFGKRLTAKMQEGLLMANGLCVLFLGLQGALNKMNLSDQTLMIILSFTFGTLLGEWLDIAGRLEQFGAWLKKISGSQSDQGFIGAFITSSLTVCVGAMAIIGSIQDGIFHDPSILYTKALLDFVIILVMAGSMGKGAIFSAVPVFLLQFSVTLLAVWIAPWLSEAMLNNLSLTGNMMIFCVGINLLWPDKIRVANMLPTLMFAVLFCLF